MYYTIYWNNLFLSRNIIMLRLRNVSYESLLLLMS